jgi:siroheme synthase (precorrin-2 oxidase/ferrochelatase)
MKREIGELFGTEYAELAELLNDARGWAKATLPTYDERKSFFEGIVNGEPDPIDLLRAGGRSAVVELIASRQAALTAQT